MAPVSFSSQTDTNISGNILKWWKNENKLIVRLDKMILSDQIFLDVALPKHKARFGLEIIETLGNKADHVCKIVALDVSKKNDGLILRDGVKIGIPTTTTLMGLGGEEGAIFAQCKLLNMEKNEVIFDTENFDVVELGDSNARTFGVFFDGIKVGEFVGSSIEKMSMTQYKISGLAMIGSIDKITYNQDELAELIENKFNELVCDEVIV